MQNGIVDIQREKIAASKVKTFVDALLSADAEAAGLIVDSLCRGGTSVPSIYFGLFTPALREVGRLWKARKIGVGVEHLASQTILEQMSRLRQTFGVQGIPRGRVLVCGVKGNQHYLGARAFSDLLLYERWEVDFLGPDMPTQEILRFLHGREYVALCLSCTVKRDLGEARSVIRAVRKSFPALRVLVGGAAIDENIEYARKIGADCVTDDPAKACELLESWINTSTELPTLEFYLARLGGRVQELRKRRKLSQQELARCAGVDRAYLSALENGKQNLSLGVVHRLARALSTTLEDLVVPTGR